MINYGADLTARLQKAGKGLGLGLLLSSTFPGRTLLLRQNKSRAGGKSVPVEADVQTNAAAAERSWQARSEEPQIHSNTLRINKLKQSLRKA